MGSALLTNLIKLTENPPYIVPALVVASAVIYVAYRFFFTGKVSLADIPGPESKSWLYGDIIELFNGPAGEKDFELLRTYGNVVRVKAPLGEDYLLIADPKALHYILSSAAYNFVFHTERKYFEKAMLGKGIGFAEGKDHKRQRRIMAPAFGPAEAKALLPIFRAKAKKLCSKWTDLLAMSPDTVVNTPNWLARATLDAIGEAAFDYHFGALSDQDNTLSKSFQTLFLDMFSEPTEGSFLFFSFLKYVPDFLLTPLLELSASKAMRRATQHRLLAESISKTLVEQKTEALLETKVEGKDIMSLIVKANASEKANLKLSEEEMLSQLQTIMLGGHETTANTLSWGLLELCKDTNIQERLRSEIRATRLKIQNEMGPGETDYTAKDFEGMKYLNAFIKEVLRYHSINTSNYRQASDNEVVPLSTPITTKSGKVLTKLVIPRGTKILISVCGYNRLETVFGMDAHTFNPDRWLREDIGKGVDTAGVYANLLTFHTGPRACIGWRFAILEMQAFLVELISNFEFSLTEEVPYSSIRRQLAVVMLPTIEGQLKKGVQLPLKIRPVAESD